MAYAQNANSKPDGYLSYRLIRRDQCKRINRDIRTMTFGTHFNGQFQDHLCILRVPEVPQGTIVEAEHGGDDQIWRHPLGVQEQTTTISVDGKAAGTYHSAWIWRLPIIPFGGIGCGLNDARAKWECFAELLRTFTVLDTAPVDIDRKLYGSPESIMLGLKKYTKADVATFQGYAVNDSVVAHIKSKQ